MSFVTYSYYNNFEAIHVLETAAHCCTKDIQPNQFVVCKNTFSIILQ